MIALLTFLLVQQSGQISPPPQNSAMRAGSGAVQPQISTGAQRQNQGQGQNQGQSQNQNGTATNQMTLTSSSDQSSGMSSQQGGGSSQSGEQSVRYDDTGLRQQGGQGGTQQNR